MGTLSGHFQKTFSGHTGRVAVWPADWMPGRQAGLVGWQAGRLAGWAAGWLVWLVNWMAGWLAGQPASWQRLLTGRPGVPWDFIET